MRKGDILGTNVYFNKVKELNASVNSTISWERF